MTYLAPRQGLFAIIILISFFIQATLLIISTDQQLDALKKQTAERMLVQLVDEVKLPLLSKDKVSLSVLTGRYTSENHVASVTVRDIDDDVLLQTGQAQLLSGDEISQPVILGDNVIGKVTLTLRDTSKGEIIASQWIYILGSFIVHLLLWLIYGYMARPTREQLAALSRDIQDHLIEQQGSRFISRSRRSRLPDDEVEDYDDGLTDTVNESNTGFDVHQAVNQYVQAHQDDNTLEDGQRANEDNRDEAPARQTNNDSKFANGDIDAAFNDDNAPSDSISTSSRGYRQGEASSQGVEGNPQHMSASGTMRQGATVPYPRKVLMSNRPIEVATVQIRFHDPSKLIGTLALEQSKPYFALCTQLLQRTLDELLQQPLLYGVKINNEPIFDANGANVEFINSGSLSKAALAAVMLAKVFVMLNQVTYIKHRELQRFALEVYAGVSDDAVAEEMQQVVRHRAKANDVLALLPTEGVKQLSGHMQLENLSNPTTVYERDCCIVKGTSDAMMQRLVEVRNAVLLSGQR